MHIITLGLPLLLATQAASNPAAARLDLSAAPACVQWNLTVANDLSFSVEIREPGVREHGAVVSGGLRSMELKPGSTEPMVEFRRLGLTLGYGVPEKGLVLAEKDVQKKLRLSFECAVWQEDGS